MQKKPARRWLKFSVRSLLLAVTLLCLWLGWQVHVVRERKAVAAASHAPFAKHILWKTVAMLPATEPNWRPSWWRKLLGDKHHFSIRVTLNDPGLSPEKVAGIFPEAQIYVYEIFEPKVEAQPSRK